MRIPKLCRNGDGRAFVRIPGSQKRLYLGQYGSSEALRAYQQCLVENVSQENSEGSIGSQFCRYLLWYQAEFPERTTHHSLLKKAGELLSDVAGVLPISALGPRIAKLFESHILKQRYRKGNTVQRYSRCYVNKLLTVYKQYVCWLCQEELIDPKQYIACQSLGGVRAGKARDPTKVAPVSVSDINKTLQCCNPQLRCLVNIQYLCGMRPGEACEMRWDEIEHTPQGSIYVPKTHKNEHRGHSLIKGIPEPALAVLSEIPHSSEWVFPNSLGNAFRVDTYRNAILKASEKAGCRWTPNMLRHALATHLSASLGYEAAQCYLGHKSLNSTQVYAHRDTQKVLEIASYLSRQNPLQEDQESVFPSRSASSPVSAQSTPPAHTGDGRTSRMPPNQ